MATHATPAEIAVLLKQTFDSGDTAQCQGFLDEAEGLILERIPDLEDRIIAGTIAFDTVAAVERRAVRRVMLNPEAKQNEKIDDYSFGRDKGTSTGEVYISDEEWSRLIPQTAPGDSFSIKLGGSGAHEIYPTRVGSDW